MKKVVSISLCYCGKKTDAEKMASRQKVFLHNGADSRSASSR